MCQFSFTASALCLTRWLLRRPGGHQLVVLLLQRHLHQEELLTLYLKNQYFLNGFKLVDQKHQQVHLNLCWSQLRLRDGIQ